MECNIKDYLLSGADDTWPSPDTLQLPEITLRPQSIRAIFLNEAVPPDPGNGFYAAGNPEYAASALSLFRGAGKVADSTRDLLEMGIYLTNVLKTPKTESAVAAGTIGKHLPVLARELALFPNLQAVMLMGDVAKKAYNTLARKRRGDKSVVPTGSTYKMRLGTFYHGDIRVFPSYIMTGKNLEIEPSKVSMIVEDIKSLFSYLDQREAL